MLSQHKVLCVGLATLDTIFVVPESPGSDGRAVASEVATCGGGPAATAAVALARLGVDVAFAGAVGDDDLGEEIRRDLRDEGIDVSRLVTVRGACSPRSVVLVEEGTGARSIVHHPGTAELLEVDADGFEWVHVDHAGWGRVRPDSARVSVDGGNPIPNLDLRGVALYSPTEPALETAFGHVDAALAAGAETVAVTRGAAGSYAATATGQRAEAPGVEVTVVSTLGAGDVFHGALVAAFLDDLALEAALRFANTAAALSCRSLDGRSAIPTRDELRSFAA